MARARNIKPGFFQNDDLGELDPLARLLFIGMWTIADFKGCIEFKPKRIKIQLLPYDNCDIEQLAINLDKSGFISIYSVQGQRYIKVINFDRHQNPHKNERESGSDIPDITEKDNEINVLSDIEINRDKNGIAPADSLIPHPDSLLLKPDTNTQKKKKPSADADDMFVGIDLQIVDDYKKLRKAKNLPATKTAMDGVKREADKAGLSFADAIKLCCERGWAGFKAEWVMQPRAGPSVKPEKFDPTAYVNRKQGVPKNEREIKFDQYGEPI